MQLFRAVMMKFILIFFLVESCGLAQGTIIQYFNNVYSQSWEDAQQYCRQYYGELPTFNTAEEQQRLIDIFGKNYSAVWIGLNRQGQNPTWQWSDGQPVSFLPWSSGYPQSDYTKNGKHHSFDCTLLNYTQGTWENVNCGTNYPFFCYRYLILVNESKTWEEALQYCTTNYIGLASLPDGIQLLQAKTEIALTQTVNVWTALRFMDGNWFWVRAQSPENPDFLPPCPARPYHCGALNSITNIWENRDCNEKLNFLCF